MRQPISDLLVILKASLYRVMELEEDDRSKVVSVSLNIAKQLWEVLDSNEKLGYFSQALVYIIKSLQHNNNLTNEQVEILVDIIIDMRFNKVDSLAIRDYKNKLYLHNIAIA